MTLIELTPAQRVARSQARLIERGGRRLNVLLQPDAAQALDALMQADSASASAIVNDTLLQAGRKAGRNKKAKP